MGDDATDQGAGGLVEEKFTHDQDRSLSDAVLDAIEQYRGEDVTESGFVLYDDIDPDALDNLFRQNARPRARLEFDTDSVRVELWGDGGVEIRVRGRAD